MSNKTFSSISLAVSLFSAILFLGMITACSLNNKQNGSGEVMGGFVGGNEGLTIHMIDGAPPSVITDKATTPFSFIMELENVGEARVGPGTDNPLVIGRLTGIMYSNFGLTSANAAKTLTSKLESAKKNFDGTILPGEIGEIGFDNLVYKPGVPDSLALTIRGEVCYDYESDATVKICVKRDLFESVEDTTLCSMRGPRPIGSSGAPLHITRVEEAPISNDTIQLNLVIEHLGNGVFFYRNTPKDLFDACVFDELDPNIYKLEVFVEPIQKDLYDVKCLRLDNQIAGGGASGVVRMFEGAPLTLTCFLKRTKPMEVRVYQDILNIRLKYRYGEFIEVPILVQSHP